MSAPSLTSWFNEHFPDLASLSSKSSEMNHELKEKVAEATETHERALQRLKEVESSRNWVGEEQVVQGSIQEALVVGSKAREAIEAAGGTEGDAELEQELESAVCKARTGQAVLGALQVMLRLEEALTAGRAEAESGAMVNAAERLERCVAALDGLEASGLGELAAVGRGTVLLLGDAVYGGWCAQIQETLVAIGWPRSNAATGLDSGRAAKLRAGVNGAVRAAEAVLGLVVTEREELMTVAAAAVVWETAHLLRAAANLHAGHAGGQGRVDWIVAWIQKMVSSVPASAVLEYEGMALEVLDIRAIFTGNVIGAARKALLKKAKADLTSGGAESLAKLVRAANSADITLSVAGSGDAARTAGLSHACATLFVGRAALATRIKKALLGAGEASRVRIADVLGEDPGISGAWIGLEQAIVRKAVEAFSGAGAETARGEGEGDESRPSLAADGLIAAAGGVAGRASEMSFVEGRRRMLRGGLKEPLEEALALMESGRLKRWSDCGPVDRAVAGIIVANSAWWIGTVLESWEGETGWVEAGQGSHVLGDLADQWSVAGRALTDHVASEVVRVFRAGSASYRRGVAAGVVNEDELEEPIAGLRSRLTRVEEAAGVDVWRRFIREVARGIGAYLWERVLLGGRFSAEGGAAVARNVHGVASAFTPWLHDPLSLMKKARDGSKLLGGPAADLEEALELVAQGGAEDASRLLGPAIGVWSLSRAEVEALGKARIDIERAE